MANEVVERIRAIARRRRVPTSQEKAAYETGRIESNFQNLPGGDADSQGWRQERASLYKDPRNLDASINRFFDEAAKLDRGQKSYELAADVQRPAAQYRGRYKDAAKEAQTLLRGGSSGAQKDATPSAPSAPSTGGGQDAREARRAALQQYLATEHTDPNALVNLATGIKAAKAIPDAPATTARAGLKTRRTSKSAGAKGSEVLELIHNDGGKGYGIKDGQDVDGPQVFSAVWAGHANHVHVAAGPETVVALGKLAQSMGLRVGENSHFGGVDPGAHVAGSYHVKDEAIDVSGDPKKMDAYARAVAKYNKTRVLPK